DEDRLIGLWLWDTALQKGCLDKPSSSVFQMILDEPWFRCTHVWKEACGKSEVAQQGRKGSWEDNLHGEALARTIQALQSDLRFTKDSIRHNQILPKCSYKGK
ncbi:hypothetical protein, partial [Pseudodesulfovibrio sp.]|uniref:hypothetical protein n=1 Tax=Pseudodesulfovibrio sp. TaxID=2035812 RepID=UPI00261E9143